MIDQKVHHVGVQGIAAHARCPRQADQRIDQIDERHLNARQLAVVIGDMKGRMLLDRLSLPLCECILECSCVEPQGEALAVICIGSPLAEIIAVGAEAADEEVTGGFDARIEVEPLNMLAKVAISGRASVALDFNRPIAIPSPCRNSEGSLSAKMSENHNFPLSIIPASPASFV